MDARTAQVNQELFQLIRGLVPKRLSGFEFTLNVRKLLLQFADGIDSPRRILVAKPERKPEEELEGKRQREFLRNRWPCMRFLSRDSAVDHLAERIQVIFLRGFPTRGVRTVRSTNFRRQKLDGPRQVRGRPGQRGNQADVTKLRDALDEQNIVRFDVAVGESGVMDRLDPGENRRQDAENLVLQQRATIQTACEGVGLVFLLGNGIGGLHRVEEILLVLLDMEDLKQFRRVLRDLAVIDDAFKLAEPGIADFCLRYDLDRHPSPGYVLAIKNVPIRTASAVR